MYQKSRSISLIKPRINGFLHHVNGNIITTKLFLPVYLRLRLFFSLSKERKFLDQRAKY